MKKLLNVIDESICDVRGMNGKRSSLIILKNI